MNALRRFLHNLTCPAPLEEFVDYDDYWETRRKAQGEPPLLHRHRYIAERIPDGASVLDIGCGDGVFLRHLQEAKPSCKIVGADISPKALERLRRQGFECTLLDSQRPVSDQFEQRFDYVVIPSSTV